MHERTGSGNNEILHMQQALKRATEAVRGPGADPLQVFPDPKSEERREDLAFNADDLAEDQEIEFRVAMAELGPGREDDEGLSVFRLSNERSNMRNPGHDPNRYEWKALLEGGQYHKMKAELDLVLEQEILPTMIVASGSADRNLNDSEKALTARIMGVEPDVVADTEFGVMQQMFSLQEGFVAAPQIENEPIKYDLEEDPETFGIDMGRIPHEATGTDSQFIGIGEFHVMEGADEGVEGSGTERVIPVVLMRVDRFPDPNGVKDYIQPTNAQKIGMTSCIRVAPNLDDPFRAHGEFDNNVVLVTSATYEPSCELEALEAVEEAGLTGLPPHMPLITAQVISYGIKKLAKVKGEEAKQPDLNQLAGTAHKVAKMLRDRGIAVTPAAEESASDESKKAGSRDRWDGSGGGWGQFPKGGPGTLITDESGVEFELE